MVALDPLLDVLGTVGLNRVPQQHDATANVAACSRSPGTAVFLLARERRFIIRAEGAWGVIR